MIFMQDISEGKNDIYMFTGIVEETGTVEGLRRNGVSFSMSIKAKKIMDDVKVGDSIAVNGICLTATDVHPDGFTVDVMPETVRRTSLENLRAGDRVNLERALRPDTRLGGHIVSGHIDGTGTIRDIKNEENATWITISASESILKYIVEKGSVAIDGISLTVAYVDSECFKVSVIPHTKNETTILEKKKGDTVNLENDIIGKYVEKLLRPSGSDGKSKTGSGLTMDKLGEYGFLG